MISISGRPMMFNKWKVAKALSPNYVDISVKRLTLHKFKVNTYE